MKNCATLLPALGLGLLIGASPASAYSLCDDLWFTRNLIFDAAGYCFGSPLGDAVFFNEGCATTTPQLSPQDAHAVAMVREIEDEWDCAVDTSQVRPLDFNLDYRLGLTDQPIATGYESACMGWQVTPAPVMSGRGPDAYQITNVQQGDDLMFGHLAVDGWEYVAIWRDNTPTGREGWVKLGEYDPARCAGWAG